MQFFTAACTEPFAVAPLLGLGGDLGGEPAAAARGRTDCEAAADAERAFTPGPALALPREICAHHRWNALWM